MLGPKCRNRPPVCGKSQMKLLKEVGSEFVSWVCVTCGCVQVWSLERTKAKAKFETERIRREQIADLQNRVEKRRRIFS